jgi:4-hydroxyacetophenone monooxygenase
MPDLDAEDDPRDVVDGRRRRGSTSRPAVAKASRERGSRPGRLAQRIRPRYNTPMIARPREEPITENDAFIARALEDANIPALMASIVHLTGDTSLLDGPIRLQPAIMGVVQGGLSAADEATVRTDALDALRAYRDRGCTLLPPSSPETVRRIMSFVVGEAVPDEYVPMMLEEMALDGNDGRDVRWDAVPLEARQRFHVVVIGAGMSGLLAAIRLEDAGIPYVVLEKNDGVGGTWRENSYPGCRVDVANHFYSYSFEPSHEWSEFYSRQPELQAYFEGCATRHGVRDKIRFGTEVVAVRFDEGAAHWEVRIRRKDGAEETLIAEAVVSAVGQLNRPKLPAIPGSDSFAGPAFHSAAWEPQHRLDGKRVAVIGTGASALQLVPELAKRVERLFVFQRQPPWVIPNPRYHAPVSAEKKWLLAHVPFYARWHRFVIFWPGSDGLLPSLVIDPTWPHQARSVNALNDAMRAYFTECIQKQIGDDPELLAKVVPSYPPFGKRMLQDNGTYFAALKRDNVDLVTDPIAAVTPTGLRCASGAEYPVDVIVFATGFHANRFLWPMEITGRGGVTLRERWGDEPRAYLGMTVPGFPNLFCLYGPGTNLAHAGSIIFHSECQVRYVMGCLHALIEKRLRTMECRADVHDAYNERYDARLATLVWSHPGMTNWYKNAAGRVTTTSPWRLVDYWRWTNAPVLDEFELH